MDVSGQLHTLTTLPLEKQSLIPNGKETGWGQKAPLDTVSIDCASSGTIPWLSNQGTVKPQYPSS